MKLVKSEHEIKFDISVRVVQEPNEPDLDTIHEQTERAIRDIFISLDIDVLNVDCSYLAFNTEWFKCT